MHTNFNQGCRQVQDGLANFEHADKQVHILGGKILASLAPQFQHNFATVHDRSV